MYVARVALWFVLRSTAGSVFPATYSIVCLKPWGRRRVVQRVDRVVGDGGLIVRMLHVEVPLVMFPRSDSFPSRWWGLSDV